jgi:hypothetical protein
MAFLKIVRSSGSRDQMLTYSNTIYKALHSISDRKRTKLNDIQEQK